MTRSNAILTITYRDASGVTYTEISRDVDADLARLGKEQPRAEIVCVDKQVGY